MSHLLLFVFCSILFTQLLRLGQRRGTDTFAVVAVNYVVAFLASLGLFIARGGTLAGGVSLHAVAAGCVNGMLFFTHVPFVLGSFREAGVGVTTAVTRAGVVIPALVAWLAWQEAMTLCRWIALALLPVSMFLLRPPELNRHRSTLRGDLMLLGCLLVAGAIFTCHKYAEVHLAPAAIETYKVTLFAVAMCASVAYAAARRHRCTGRELGVGMMLGLSNTAALIFVMLGLASVSAVVFYPTSGSLTICLNVAVSRVLWRERLTARQVAGLLLAVAVVVLVNR